MENNQTFNICFAATVKSRRAELYMREEFFRRPEIICEILLQKNSERERLTTKSLIKVKKYIELNYKKEKRLLPLKALLENYVIA